MTDGRHECLLLFVIVGSVPVIGSPTVAQAQPACTSTDTAVTAVNPDDADSLAGDCAALLGLMDTLRGTGTLNWANTLSMASWDGITLASTKNRVTGLQLLSKDLPGGSIPDLSALTSLTMLSLQGNGLTGSIVAAHLPASLQSLKLGSNRLTGSIPDLSALTSLTALALQANGLTGTIPDLSSLHQLEALVLEANELTGDIVAAHLPASLETLSLGSNGLTGTIPDLSALTSLRILQFHTNGLTGTIPDLSALTSLTHINLTQNELTGSIPDLSAVTNLQQLVLAHNELTDTIPDLSALTSLIGLSLQANELTGSIVAAHLPPSLQQLSLHDNELGGNIPDLNALTNLQILALSDNELTGSIPDLSALTSLEQLYLHRNRLMGSIPDLNALTNLTSLHLAWNRLTGGISPQLDSLTNLQQLSLCENDLDASATLPTALETRRTANMLTVYSCLRLADAEGPEGTVLRFGVTHSTWPVRGGDSLTFDYATEDGTATGADYGTAMGSVTVPAVSATDSAAVAEIEVTTFADCLQENDETLAVIVSPPPTGATSHDVALGRRRHDPERSAGPGRL